MSELTRGLGKARKPAAGTVRGPGAKPLKLKSLYLSNAKPKQHFAK